MNCPRCRKDLLQPTEIAEGDITARPLTCTGCGGHLFESKDLRKIEETVVLHPFSPPAQIPTMRTQHKTLMCPRCSDHPPMRKVSNQRHQEVITDVCPSCEAVWLDGGELERIQEEGIFKTIAFCLKWLRE